MLSKRLLRRCGACLSLRQGILWCKLKHAPHLLILAAALAAMGGRVARAQWVQMNGPYGGEVYCLAVIGTNLFASVNGSNIGHLGNRGIFRTTDNGNYWTAVRLSKKESIAQLIAVGTNLFAVLYQDSGGVVILFAPRIAGRVGLLQVWGCLRTSICGWKFKGRIS